MIRFPADLKVWVGEPDPLPIAVTTAKKGGREEEVCIQYNIPPITFDTLVTGLDKPDGD